jgi:hypothetical protein
MQKMVDLVARLGNILKEKVIFELIHLHQHPTCPTCNMPN